MGADLLRSIRNDPKKQPALAAHIMALPAAAAQAVAAQAAAAQAAAARAAAHAAHVRHARLAAAQLMASREEDPNAWLRIEAPVFQPGARQENESESEFDASCEDILGFEALRMVRMTMGK